MNTLKKLKMARGQFIRNDVRSWDNEVLQPLDRHARAGARGEGVRGRDVRPENPLQGLEKAQNRLGNDKAAKAHGGSQRRTGAPISPDRHAVSRSTLGRNDHPKNPLQGLEKARNRPGNGTGARIALQLSIFSAAMNASCGISTFPNWRMRFLPAFCFSRSLRLRLISPP